jgi:hypothetical protein
MKSKWDLSIQKTKMALISGISGSAAILNILFELGAVYYSRLPIFILCNTILGNQKVSKERVT